jgi:hypothetical protein
MRWEKMLLLFIVVFGGSTALRAQPVKLAVDVPSPVAAPNATISCVVRLLDGANRPFTPKADLPVDLLVTTTEGHSVRQSLTISAGQQTGAVQVPLPSSGLVRLRAQHRALLDGEAFVRVTIPTAPDVTPVLYLWYAPQCRTLVANGRDPALVQAAMSAPAPTDIRLQFQASGGRLSPRQSVVIPKGQISVAFPVSALRSGDVTVQFLGAQPPVKCHDPSVLRIRFAQMPVQVRLRTPTNDIRLGSRLPLIVLLTDENGEPCAADVPREVRLQVMDGTAVICPAILHFDAGQSEARATAFPLVAGVVGLSGESLRLGDGILSANVQWPVAVLIATLLSGVTVGLVAESIRWRHQPYSRHPGGWLVVAVGRGLLGSVGGLIAFVVVIAMVNVAGALWMWLPVPDHLVSMPIGMLCGALGSWVTLPVAQRLRPSND